VAAWIDNTFTFENEEKVVFALTVVITVLVLPAVAWILITAINTDFANLPGRSKGIVIAAVGVFIVVGFAFGARNDLFLDCGDFQISGNDRPANCLEVSPENP
jgi:hypothetical protein